MDSKNYFFIKKLLVLRCLNIQGSGNWAFLGEFRGGNKHG